MGFVVGCNILRLAAEFYSAMVRHMFFERNCGKKYFYKIRWAINLAILE
jgi:hypothetical protein